MKIALLPGGFKPPHLGHYNMAKYLADFADNVIVRIGQKEREGIGAPLALEVWNFYKEFDPDPRSKKLTISVAQSPSPVKDVYDFVEKTAPEGSTVILGLGEKDATDGRYNNIPKFAEPRNIKADIELVPPQAGGISGTRMREIIKSNNKEEFFKYIPGFLPEEIKEELWTKLVDSTMPTDIDEMMGGTMNREEMAKHMANMKKLRKFFSKQGDQMVQVPSKLTSGLKRKLYEGRYDGEVLRLSRYLVNMFKAELGNPYTSPRGDSGESWDEPAKGTLTTSKGVKINFDFDFKFVPSDASDKRLGPLPFVVSGAGDEDGMEVGIIYNPEAFPEAYNDLIAEIKDTIRHEIEHIAQGLFNKGVVKDYEEEQGEGFEYFTAPEEIPAFVQGLYKQAKTRKISLSKMIDKFLATRELDFDNPQEIEQTRKIWVDWARKNLPAAQLDENYPPYKANQIQQTRYRASDTFTNDPKKAKKLGYLEDNAVDENYIKDLMVKVKQAAQLQRQDFKEFFPLLKKWKDKVITDDEKYQLKILLVDLLKTAGIVVTAPVIGITVSMLLSTLIKKISKGKYTYLAPSRIAAALEEGDTYEKMAAKGKKAGNLKQGTVRKRLNIPKGEKIPLSLINKELSRLKKMEKRSAKNQKYYKALTLAKTLKTTTNVNEGDPKVGTGKKPKGSGRRLYTDENPKDTVSIKFSTRQDIVDTLSKKSFKSKSHARQSQIINLIHQRVRAAYGRAKDPAVKKRLKSGLDYITKRKEASKRKTQRMRKEGLFSQEWWLNIITEDILNEGGAAGHMAHPFDLPNVKTGKDLIKSFEQAADSLKKTPGSVKIDGVNASIRLINLDGKRVFAMDRGSKKALDLRGVTKADLEDRFGAGHGMIKSGGDVLDIFNAALPSIQEELNALGLIDDPNVMFNMEYVSGKSNVQDYGKNFLAIHGLLKVETKEVQGARKMLTKRVTTEKPFAQSDMDELLKKLEPFAKKKGFEIYGSVPTTFTKDPDFKSALNTRYTIDTAEGDQTKTLAQWLDGVTNIPKTDRLKMNIEETDSIKDVGALSKQVYFAVFGGENVDSLFSNEQEVNKAIQGATTYLATEKLGDAILDVLDSPMGSVNDHEGVVIRDDKISPKPFKITGKFITGGVSSEFQKK